MRESQQIRPGTGKGSIDCKELAARLRMEFSDFTWVSVKLKGTRLFIDVTENTDSGAARRPEQKKKNLPAAWSAQWTERSYDYPGGHAAGFCGRYGSKRRCADQRKAGNI